jgi:hypothetical protein
MDESVPRGLREEAKNWTCNNLAITDHGGDAAKLLRKLADAIEELGDIEILNITYRPPTEPPLLEITVSLYFYFRSEPD